MTRGQSNLILLIIAVLAIGASYPVSAEERNRRPNILFIAIDDLNDWVGFFGGHPQVKTPNMDRLAARGTVFTNAHCAAPLCGPSRAAVFSGLFPTRRESMKTGRTSRKRNRDLCTCRNISRGTGTRPSAPESSSTRAAPASSKNTSQPNSAGAR